MEFTWKKVLITVLFFVSLIAGPVFLCSNMMMEYYQKKIDAEPQTGYHKWLQMASADLCYKTDRPEMAAEYYRKFRDNYKEDERRPRAALRYAQALEECNRNADAMAEYQRFLQEYPDRKEAAEAILGVERVRNKPIK